MIKKIMIAVLSVTLFSLSACETNGPRYRDVRSYSEGLAPVKMNNGKWGYVDSRQRLVIPAIYEDAKEFMDGKAAVKQRGKWGFINKQGRWL
ncbi:MAG TPA: WG repeat-containing protein [Methylotenera sp.]